MVCGYENDGNPKLQNCTSANSAVHAMGLNKYGQTSVVSVSTKACLRQRSPQRGCETKLVTRHVQPFLVEERF